MKWNMICTEFMLLNSLRLVIHPHFFLFLNRIVPYVPFSTCRTWNYLKWIKCEFHKYSIQCENNAIMPHFFASFCTRRILNVIISVYMKSHYKFDEQMVQLITNKIELKWTNKFKIISRVTAHDIAIRDHFGKTYTQTHAYVGFSIFWLSEVKEPIQYY